MKLTIEKINLNHSFPDNYFYADDVKNIINHTPKLHTYIQNETINLSENQIKVINKMQRRHLTKDELECFYDLPSELSNKLRRYSFVWSDGGYHCDTNQRIRFWYKKKLTFSRIKKSVLNSCKQLLPLIVPSLLYHHWYIKPIDNLWTYTQDPILINKNKEKELTNLLIENLQTNGIPGSKLLTKHVIDIIPLQKILPDEKYREYILNQIITTIIPSVIFNIEFFIIPPKYQYYHPSRNSWDDLIRIKYMLDNMGYFYFSSVHAVCDYPLSKIFFSYGIPIGLIAITLTTAIIGFIKEIINSRIFKLKSIDFFHQKFKNKSTNTYMSAKEVISYYLNNPSIEIYNGI